MRDLIVDGLATFRLTRLITEDTILDAPRDALLRFATTEQCIATLDRRGNELHCGRPGGHGGLHDAIRRQVYGDEERIDWSDDEAGATAPDPEARRHPKLAEFIQCPWCVGMWVAAAVTAARVVAPRRWDPVARLLACSAAAGVIAEST